MHKEGLRRKSRTLMEIVMDEEKGLQKQQANDLFSSLHGEDNLSSSTVSKKKKKGCRSKGEGRKYGLLSFNELPGYMKDNEFILNYYRAEWPLKEAFFSLFRWHNETLNVWT